MHKQTHQDAPDARQPLLISTGSPPVPSLVQELVNEAWRACRGVDNGELATMGAALADGGVNPHTGERVVGADVCKRVLAALATAGMYERTGDWLSFISNDLLRQRLARTIATSEQVDEAVRINTDARLLALKLAFFTLAGFALLAYFPAGALPGYVGSTAPPPREEELAEQRPVRSAMPPAG